MQQMETVKISELKTVKEVEAARSKFREEHRKISEKLKELEYQRARLLTAERVKSIPRLAGGGAPLEVFQKYLRTFRAEEDLDRHVLSIREMDAERWVKEGRRVAIIALGQGDVADIRDKLEVHVGTFKKTDGGYDLCREWSLGATEYGAGRTIRKEEDGTRGPPTDAEIWDEPANMFFFPSFYVDSGHLEQDDAYFVALCTCRVCGMPTVHEYGSRRCICPKCADEVVCATDCEEDRESEKEED